MSARPAGWRRIFRFWRDPAADVDAELQFHFEQKIADLIAQGLSADQARARAVAEFGDATVVRDDLVTIAERMAERRGRAESIALNLARLRDDFAIAVRSLRTNIGFTFAVVGILGVGIGMSVAMFTVVRSVMIERLPVRDQDRIVELATSTNGARDVDPEGTDVKPFQRTTRTMSDVALFGHWGAYAMALVDGDRPLAINQSQVTSNFFDMLGAQPERGRFFRPEDDVLGANPVTVISHATWQRQFHGDTAILGHQLTWLAGSRVFTIVGVAPPGLDYPAGTDYWIPIALQGIPSVIVVGRLTPNATIDAAKTEYAATMHQVKPASYGDGGIARTLPEVVLGNIRPVLLLLTAAVALLLLIACANVASLLLLRGTRRGREIAIRRAIGASYGDVVRLLLSESALLATLGGALGFACAEGALRMIVTLAPAQLPRVDTIKLGASTVTAAIGATVLAVLIFGVAPAFITARTRNLSSTLRLDTRSGNVTTTRRRAQRWLVASQLALALVMLSGAGLLARSLYRLNTVDLGYKAEGLSILELGWYQILRYPVPVTDVLMPQLRAIPGVTAATPILIVPFLGTNVWLWPFEPEHFVSDEQFPRIPVEVGEEEYFKTVGIPILRGRSFEKSDRVGAPLVVVVSEGAASKLWPGQNPVGKRVRLPHMPDVIPGDSSWRTVVGLVGDTRYREMRNAAPMVYFPAAQSAWQGTFAVRTNVPLSAVLPQIRKIVHDAEPNLVVWRARTMDDFLATPLARPRLSALLVSLFGVVALLLAAVGLYGVISFVVREQSHEIAVRMALGASPANVGRQVLRQALSVLAPGAAAGLVCAFVVSRMLGALLYQVSPGDPIALLGACAVLIAVGAAAAYFPVRNATRVDPASVLKAG